MRQLPFSTSAVSNEKEADITRGTKLAGNKRIFLVTDNDAPPGSESNIAPAQTVYGDLLTYGITVNTYFIDRPEHRFDPRGYWNVSSPLFPS